MYPVTVVLEGISPDLTTANGEYGAQATYTLGSEQELVDFFARIQMLKHVTGSHGCPPTVTLQSTEGDTRYYPDGGRILSEGTDTFVTPQDVARILETPGAEAHVRTRSQRAKGKQPVRMHHVPPTKGIDPPIDAGPHQPQVAFRLFVSDKARGGPYFWTALGLFFTAIGVLAVATDGPAPAMFMALPGAIMIGGAMWWWPRRKAETRYGFDWSTNTMWCSYFHGVERRLGFVPDANLITQVALQEIAYDAGHDIVGVNRIWLVEARRVGDKKIPKTLGPSIYNKGEAKLVLAGVEALLDSQR